MWRGVEKSISPGGRVWQADSPHAGLCPSHGAVGGALSPAGMRLPGLATVQRCLRCNPVVVRTGQPGL
jgi:hypothetical protein